MAGKYKLKVKESKIQGKGVYACEPIEANKRVIEYGGTIKPIDDYSFGDYVFLMEVDEDHVIDPRINGNEAVFINHSCDPNCYARQIRKKVYIYSLRKIKKGEELSYDYNIVLDFKPNKKEKSYFKCKCNNKNCKRTMISK